MEVKDSVRKDALQKIREHIAVANICMTTNNILEWALQPESLSNQWLDDDGNIWFLYSSQSRPSELSDGRMEVFYSNRSKSRFLSLVGEIKFESFDDVANINEFLNEDRGQDPTLRVARFTPFEAYYWDEIMTDMVPLVLYSEVSPNRNRLVA
jgi:hypothetical protein